MIVLMDSIYGLLKSRYIALDGTFYDAVSIRRHMKSRLDDRSTFLLTKLGVAAI